MLWPSQNIWTLKQGIKKWLEKRYPLLCEEFKNKEKKEQKFFDRSRNLNPRFSVTFPPTIWIFMERVEPKIKSKQASNRDRTLLILTANPLLEDYCNLTPSSLLPLTYSEIFKKACSKVIIFYIHRKILSPRPHRDVFWQFLFWWIYYCHSSKSTGKENGKMHLYALCVLWKLELSFRNWFNPLCGY